MKKTITILFIFFNVTLSNAQDDCETYIDFMTKAVEQNNIDKAKADMEAYTSCMEQETGSNEFIINNLKKINAVIWHKDNNYFAKDINGTFNLVDNNFFIIKSLDFDRFRIINKGETIIGIKNGLYYILDSSGSKINSNSFKSIYKMNNGYNVVSTSNNKSFTNQLLDQKGNLFIIHQAFILDCSYSEGYLGFSYINSLRKKNNKTGYLDINRNIVLSTDYEYVGPFKNGIARVANYNHKSSSRFDYYFIDTNGKEINKEKYENAKDFREGVAAVKKNGKWGFIDTSNNIIIDFQYDEAKYFRKGVACVKQNGKWKIIDQTNKTISENYNFYDKHPDEINYGGVNGFEWRRQALNLLNQFKEDEEDYKID